MSSMSELSGQLELQTALAEAVATCKALTARYLAGFDDATAAAQAQNLPNHVLWSLGHCALTMHRVAAMIDKDPLPEADFTTTPSTDTTRPNAFNPELVAFGSSPSASADAYPTLARAREIYDRACDRLADAVRRAPLEQLATPVPWGQMSMPAYLLVTRMIFHNGFHTGQVADLRRAMGFKSVFT